MSEWQQDGGHRSSRVFNLHSLSCPIYPSVFAVSAHLRSLVSLSPFFAFPLSPPPRDGWGKKNNVEGGWEEAKRHSSVPCQMSKNKSLEKTDRARLTLLSGAVKVGGPSDEIVLLSARVCVYVCLCDPPTELRRLHRRGDKMDGREERGGEVNRSEDKREEGRGERVGREKKKVMKTKVL